MCEEMRSLSKELLITQKKKNQRKILELKKHLKGKRKEIIGKYHGRWKRKEIRFVSWKTEPKK